MAPADSTDTAPTRGATTPAKPARDNLIHIVRGVAIAAVVTYHQLIQHMEADGRTLFPAPIGYEWVNWFLIWAVPWFVLSGGAVSYWGVKRLWEHTVPGRHRRRETVKYLWGRLVRMMVPYYVFAAILAPTEVLLGAIGGDEGICKGFGLEQALTWIIPFPHADCMVMPRFPFWFLMVYVPVALSAPILVWIFERRWGRWLLLAVPPVVILWNDRLFYALKGLTIKDKEAIEALVTPVSAMTGLVDIILGFVLFFVVGFTYAAGMWNGRRRLPAGLGLALMAATILLMTVGPYPTGGQQLPIMAGYLFWGIGTFLITVAGRDPVQRVWRLPVVKPTIDWLSTKSYTLYIWHSTLIVAAWWTLQAVGANGPLYAMPMMVGHLAIFAVSWIYIVPVVNLAYRFESWTVPPRWWERRRHRSLPVAEQAGAAVGP